MGGMKAWLEFRKGGKDKKVAELSDIFHGVRKRDGIVAGGGWKAKRLQTGTIQ